MSNQLCFVVMGFGEKTDFQSNPQRLLNLNRTYEDILQPAVTESNVECIRADKIIHSTVIDQHGGQNMGQLCQVNYVASRKTLGDRSIHGV